MLATSSSFNRHAFLPLVPSPLSPRSANIHGRYSHFESMSGSSSLRPSDTKVDVQNSSDATTTRTTTTTNVPFSKRAVKKAPSPKHDELRERRRNAFLRRVQEGRDDKRFEARGDDIMRLDFLRRQRAWEAQQALAASDAALDINEEDFAEEYDLPISSTDAMQASQSMIEEMGEEADEWWQRENDELEALIDYMPSSPNVGGYVDDDPSEHFGSDDDDYDALFHELMDPTQRQMEPDSGTEQRQEQNQAYVLNDDEAMDMT